MKKRERLANSKLPIKSFVVGIHGEKLSNYKEAARVIGKRC